MSNNAELQRTQSYQWPSEHIGHLAPKYGQALEKFKLFCEQKGYYAPAGATASGVASHDDETLLRYLRARKWNVNDAFGQFKDTEDWRKENQIENLYDTIDTKEYEVSRKLYPQWTGRRDKRGIPVYVFEVAHLNSKAVTAYESSLKPGAVPSKVPPKMLRLFALYENLTQFVLPLCSALPDRPYRETPISQSSNIVDISGVGLRQFWNLKQHMQDASQLATAYYPETLDRIFIIGAPSFFPTVWGWIKRWFDPITVSKIFILDKHSMKSTLEQHMAPEHIPKKYGGQLDFEFGDLPNLDPATEKALQWQNAVKYKGRNTLPTGPMRWQKAQGGEFVATAVGSEGGRRRNHVVATLRPDPATTQTSLSPGDQRNLELMRTSSGVHTHPPSPPAGAVEMESPPAEESPEASVRQGTTATRYEQQSDTHGHGQLAENTPDMRTAPDGERYGVMEPGTVAQAPKEHPVPEPEEPEQTYVDQAKEMADQAYATALGAAGAAMKAVGLNKEGQEVDKSSEVAEHKVPEDSRVDKADPQQVEEFLRYNYHSQTASQARK